MHIFVDALRPCLSTPSWPHRESCHLLSDNLPDLRRFARHIRLNDDWLQWSNKSTPHYDLTRGMRLKAVLAGAVEISDAEAASLTALWHARAHATLARLLAKAPGLASRLARRPHPTM